MKQVTKDNFFQEVIKASYEQPVLVQFWAPWCGPCHGLSATIDQIAEQKDFPVKYFGLDVDQFTDVALQYKVWGVPHTKIFVSGHPISDFSDPLPIHEVSLFIKNALVLPRILNYSHYKGDVDTGIINDLEKGVEQSVRRDNYFLTLARYYFFSDQKKSRQYLEKIPDKSDQFEARLFIQDLYPLMSIEFSHNPVQKKLWAAKNALKKKNFESTYQFLLQANRIGSGSKAEFPRLALFGFHRFLGPDHELSRKYQTQFDQVV